MTICFVFFKKEKIFRSELGILGNFFEGKKGLLLWLFTVRMRGVFGSGDLSKNTASKFGSAWGFEPVFVFSGVPGRISSFSLETSIFMEQFCVGCMQHAPAELLRCLFTNHS